MLKLQLLYISKKSQTPDQIQKKSIILDCAVWSIMCYSFYNRLKSTGSSSFLLLVLIVHYTVKKVNLYEAFYITFFFSQRFSLFFLFIKIAHTQQRSNQQEENLRPLAPLFSQDIYSTNGEHTTLLNVFSYSNVVSESAH